jgi:heme/copper-type cytochrome/quinol oxidase subunit 2
MAATTTPSLPTLIVNSGEVSGPDTLDFKLGTEAVFEVVADVADEVHVHGYDLHFDTQPGVPTQIRFTADVPGEFEVELEGASLELVKLVVEP